MASSPFQQALAVAGGAPAAPAPAKPKSPFQMALDSFYNFGAGLVQQGKDVGTILRTPYAIPGIREAVTAMGGGSTIPTDAQTGAALPSALNAVAGVAAGGVASEALPLLGPVERAAGMGLSPVARSAAIGASAGGVGQAAQDVAQRTPFGQAVFNVGAGTALGATLGAVSPHATPEAASKFPLPAEQAQLPISSKPIMAARLKDGTVIADPSAIHHGDLAIKAGIDPDEIIDTGFVVDGKYVGPDLPPPDWALEGAKARGYDTRPGTYVSFDKTRMSPFENPAKRILQPTSANADFVAKVQADPAFAKGVLETGAKKTLHDPEMYQMLAQAPDMTEEELLSRGEHDPVGLLDPLRASALLNRVASESADKLANGDIEAQQGIAARYGSLMAAADKLTATPGRTLRSMQAIPDIDASIKRLLLVKELTDRGVPWEVAGKSVDQAMKDMPGKVNDAGLEQIRRGAIRYSQWAKITSPMTWAFKGLGDAGMTILRGMRQSAVAIERRAAGDVAGADAAASTAFGTGTGWQEAGRKYIDVLLHGPPEAAGEFGLLEKGPLAIPGRMLMAPTFAFRALWDDAVRHEWAFRVVSKIREADPSMTDEQFGQRVSQLAAEAIPAIRKKAEQEGLVNTFTNRDDILKALEPLRNLPGVPGFVMKAIVVPFLQVPYNLGRTAYSYSALSAIAPGNYVKAAAQDELGEQTRARMVNGIMLSAVGVGMALRGDITGQAPNPRDPEYRNWQAEGKRPYSVKIGGHWYNYGRWLPIGPILGLSADMVDAVKKGGPVDKLGLRLAASMTHEMSQQPFLEGMADLVDLIKDPVGSAERFARGAVTGFIPNIVRDIRIQTDRTVRQPTSMLDAIQNFIPGLSQNVAPMVNELGRQVQTEANPALRATKVVTPEASAYDRGIVDLVRSVGSHIPSPSVNFVMDNGAKIKLMGNERARFYEDIRGAVRDSLGALQQDPTFRGESPEERKQDVDWVIRDAASNVRADWRDRLAGGKR